MSAADNIPAVYPAGTNRERLMSVARFPATLLTRPGAAAYGWFSRRVRDRRLRHCHSALHGVRVISIGNLEVGGNGKTPLAVHLIQRLEALGHRPVYVSRGFKSVSERLPMVTVCLPANSGGEKAPADDTRIVTHGRGLAADIGDEGAMVALRCPRTPLVFSRNRPAAVETAAGWLGATHVILDDAFQSWHVHRDVDVVLLDGRRPFGNGRLLPAGTLRESAAALSRANLIGINGIETENDLDRVCKGLEAIGHGEIPVFGLRRGVLFVDGSGKEVRAPVGVAVTLSSIARPEGLDRVVTQAGVDVSLSVRFPDHHSYSQRDIQRISKAIAEVKASAVVTTEKDWVKLCDWDLPFACTVARLELVVEGHDPVPIIEKPQAVPAASSRA
jgi:tetraacyldisaccharide 4'-kinase